MPVNGLFSLSHTHTLSLSVAILAQAVYWLEPPFCTPSACQAEITAAEWCAGQNETGLKGVRDFVVLPSIPGKAEILRHEWILRLAIDLGSKFEPGKAPKATIWASKMVPKNRRFGGPGHQNPS